MKNGLLQPHQLDSLKWMASLHSNNINGILADEMGLGKTIQTVSILCYLWENRNIDASEPHLIIVPKSTVPNWVKEFKKWAPHFTTVNLVPTAEFRKEILEH